MSEKPLSDVEYEHEELKEYLDISQSYLEGLQIINKNIKYYYTFCDKHSPVYCNYILPNMDRFIEIYRELNLEIERELGERIPIETLEWSTFVIGGDNRIIHITNVYKIVDALKSLLTKKRKELERLKRQELRKTLSFSKQKDEKIKEDNIVEEEIKDGEHKQLFMDDQKNILYFDKKKMVTLKPEEIKLIKYMRKQEAFELEQILTEHFKIKLTKTHKHSKNIDDELPENRAKPSIEEKSNAISKGDRNKFEVYKSNINKKCKSLGIGDIIIRHPIVMKAFKLSVKITKKTLQL